MDVHEIEKDEDDGPPPGWEPITPSLPLPPPPQLSSADMAQMVCGTCRRLLKYLKGARYVQCSCCSTVNFVLEAHEVGQVKCGSCAVLLMYPYGASSVRCSSCTSVTEIGVHNRRPPWSVHQGQAAPPTNFVQ
ncbi:protein LOL2 isoform X1 [Cucumis sativus]|uniref:protein LOL2 isoform X1 n=1 Tax=Cucumis sativus TaxID=3659 RepID=UPI0005ED4090|nr:protein LOL2 isoform X1 [Cucumis sativus]